MKLTIRGKGASVDLNQKHFLAAGGEGKIYVKDGLVYKVCEPGKMIPDGKIQELMILDRPNIIRPQDVLIDSKQNPVGYTMRYCPDSYVLCQLFTKAFRNRNNITPDMMLKLVRNMQETIQFIHRKNTLLVDLNEMNFLSDQAFTEIFFIDVNSYQTPHYPALAIMDSIRDRHCNNHFTENTDWFSFGIVAFQMLIGIHPFKGKHPSFTDAHTALDGRMKSNISIFNKQVTYPTGACQPLTVIPDVYRQWFEAVFDQGKRLPPPSDLIAAIQIIAPIIKKIAGSNNFDIMDLFDFEDEIVSVFNFGGRELVATNKKLFIDRREKTNFTPTPDMKICFTPKSLRPIAASIENRKLKLMDLVDNKPLQTILSADKLFVVDGRLYVLHGSQILEMQFMEIGTNTVVSSNVVGTVLESGTQLHDGVIVQNLFDSHYISVFPASKECRQIALRALDGYRLIEAKYERGLLMAVAVDNKTGKYDRFIFWFDNKWNPQHTIIKDITFTGLNFTVLDNGVCIMINEDEVVEIFRVADPTTRKEIDDPIVESDMELCSKGSQTMFTRGGKLYSFSMAKKNP